MKRLIESIDKSRRMPALKKSGARMIPVIFQARSGIDEMVYLPGVKVCPERRSVSVVNHVCACRRVATQE